MGNLVSWIPSFGFEITDNDVLEDSGNQYKGNFVAGKNPGSISFLQYGHFIHNPPFQINTNTYNRKMLIQEK